MMALAGNPDGLLSYQHMLPYRWLYHSQQSTTDFLPVLFLATCLEWAHLLDTFVVSFCLSDL